jgi:hypothetical protein
VTGTPTSTRLTALVLAGLALRIVPMIGRPLWLDEALQVHVATAHHLLGALARWDLHPPLSALLTRAVSWLGDDDLTLRLPSLLASLATIPLAAWAARGWASSAAASFAAASATVLPPLVLYAGEARPYAVGVCLLTAFVGAIGHRLPLAAAGVGTLAVLAQYGAWPVVAVGGVVAVRRDGRPWPWLLPTLAAAGLATTLLPAQLAHQGAGLSSGFLADAFFTPLTFPRWLATQPTTLLGWYLTGTNGRTAAGLGAALLVLLAVGARGRRADALTVLAWGPAAALVALAGLGLHPLGPTRHALVLLPGLLVWGARRVGERPTLAAVTVGVLAGGGLLVSPSLPREDAPGLVAALDDLDELPVLADASAAPQLSRYARRTVAWLPWVRGDALRRQLASHAPTGPFWFAVGSTGGTALADAETWAEEDGRALGPLVVRQGMQARRIGPVVR